MSRSRRGLARSAEDRPTRAAHARPSGRLPLVVGLAAALLLAIGAVVAIVVLGDRGGAGPGEPGAASGQPEAGRPAESAASPGTTTGAGPEPSASIRPEASLPGGEPLRSGFKTAPELCEAGDFSSVFAILDRSEVLNDHEQSEPDFYQRSCVFTLAGGASQGRFSLEVTVPASRVEAERWYEDLVAGQADRNPAQEPVDGDWDESTALTLPTVSPEADVRVLARDGVLVVNVSSYVIGEAADRAALRAALVQVAEWVRDAMRS